MVMCNIESLSLPPAILHSAVRVRIYESSHGVCERKKGEREIFFDIFVRRRESLYRQAGSRTRKQCSRLN